MKFLHVLIICGLILTGGSFAINDVYAAGFIKFDGIDGESIDKDHKGWSDLLSFSESATSKDDSSTARTKGETTLQDMVVVKALDKSSPKLAESILMGKVYPKVEIHFASSDRVTYYAYELTNVMVTSYSVSGDVDEVPMEEFSLNFEEIKVTYTERDSEGKKKGNIEYSWKVEEGTA